MLTYGSLGFGILAVVVPLVLYRVKRAEVPIFLSMAFGMASLTCVAAIMGTSALEDNSSMFYGTAPAFMYCSITLRAGARHQCMAAVVFISQACVTPALR